MKRRALLLFLPAVLGGALFARYGRSLWVPLVNRLRGKRSVEDILARYATPETDALADGSPLALVGFKQEQRLRR